MLLSVGSPQSREGDERKEAKQDASACFDLGRRPSRSAPFIRNTAQRSAFPLDATSRPNTPEDGCASW